MLEGFLLYKVLVVVFQSGDEKLYLVYLVGYAAPLVVAIVTIIAVLILERDNGGDTNYSSDICRLGEPYNYYALIAPICAVLLFNFFVLIRGILVTWKVIFYLSGAEHFTFLVPSFFCFSGNKSKITRQLQKGQKMAKKLHSALLFARHVLDCEYRGCFYR